MNPETILQWLVVLLLFPIAAGMWISFVYIGVVILKELKELLK